MVSEAVAAVTVQRPADTGSVPTPATERHGWPRPLIVAAWVLGLVGLVVLGAVWVDLTNTRPSYDAYGWLVWGKETLAGHLNTDGAPSWKPLSYLFTLPYAAFGHGQLRWWTVTSSAAAIGSIVFAARIAYRLTVPIGRRDLRRWPGLIAGAFAGVTIAGLGGLAHQVLIANSDPMVITFCLAGIDAHLCRRPRLAFVALVLASLGRPEVWPFAALYAAWTWRAVPRARWLLVLGTLLIPAAWFVIPGLTSHSWLISGTLALQSPDVVHGDKFTGVLSRFVAIYELPMQIAVLAALAIAALRRERSAFVLAGAAALWVAVEIAFAYHGWPASPRYLLEAAAVCVALAGAGVGWALQAMSERGGWLVPAGLVGLAAVVVALVPIEQHRVQKFDRQLGDAQRAALRQDRLQTLIADVGGARQIERCGHPVTFVGYQSDLAWRLGLNVGKVGYKPGREIRKGIPIVLFRPHQSGWELRPMHWRPAQAALCQAMRVDYAIGRAGAYPVPVPSPFTPAVHRHHVGSRTGARHRHGQTSRRHRGRHVAGRLRHRGPHSRHSHLRSHRAHRSAGTSRRGADAYRSGTRVRHQRRRTNRSVSAASVARVRRAGTGAS